MPARLSRAAYAGMYGPTTGDRVRLADTDLVIEVEKDHTIYGEEVKFGGGKVIRDGMGQSQRTRAEGAMDTVITNALILDHWGVVKADVGLKDGRIAAIGKAGNPDTQPGVTIVIGPGTEIIAGEGRILTAGGLDVHIHFICPQQIEEALAAGVTTMFGGGTGPAHGTLATTVDARALAHGAHAAGGRGVPDEPRLPRQGQRRAARGAGGADQGRRLRPEAARGLGHHAQGHRHLPPRRRRDGRAGGDPHRHPERERLRREHDRRHRGPHHPGLPHGGRRRRPRARHPARRGRAELPALLHQPDHALHREHGGRAPRHADGLPPPRPAHRRGRGLRRKPHPARDHRRRGHPARPRRHLHDVERQPGDGARRRGDHPHLADRAQDEGAARQAAGRDGRERQPAGAALHRQVHDQPRHRAGHRRACGQRGGRQARRPRAVVAGLFRRQARHGAEMRQHRRGADGRPQRLHPDAAAGALPADVRRLRRRGRALRRHLRVAGGADRGRGARATACRRRCWRWRTRAGASGSATWC